MPITANYLFMASMDVEPEKEALFHEVYDTEHVPYLLEVPGVLSVTRIEGEPFALKIAGETREVPREGARFTAIYEIESPDVLLSDAWAEAVERGRWAEEVRPYTSNRRHTLSRVQR